MMDGTPPLSKASWIPILAVIFVLGGSWSASAELRIDITRGTVEPLPIAVTDFFGSAEDETRFGRDIASVVAADLERSGLFRPIDSRAFIQTGHALSGLPRFPDWRVLNAQALVQGRTQIVEDGLLRV